MNRNINVIFTFVFIVLPFLTNFCTPDSRKTQEKAVVSKTYPTEKNIYELTEEFLDNLKKDKVDTIVFYKRICINCCEFFNIFWVSNGQQNLTKLYYDFDDRQTHSKTVSLTNSKVFEILNLCYDELKNTMIKGNSHRNKDGTYSVSIVDHHCYAEMKIFLKQDSIITNRMEDHAFDEYTNFGATVSDSNEKRQTNDGYKENINSKWNLWLTTIENELAIIPIIVTGEKEAMRTRE